MLIIHYSNGCHKEVPTWGITFKLEGNTVKVLQMIVDMNMKTITKDGENYN